MRLPTKGEWEAAGFSVPQELCHDERELTPHEVIRALARGDSDPISDLANSIVTELDRAVRGRGEMWEDLELVKIVEEEIQRFLLRIINAKERANP
jgi:hypothetical protein